MIKKKSKGGKGKKKLFLLLFLLFLFVVVAVKGVEIYQMHRQIAEAEEKRTELLQEQQELEAKKQELQDPKVIEKQARDQLGMVKSGEVPYIK